MYVYKIKRLSDSVITHVIKTEDSNYIPSIPSGWDLEDNHEVLVEDITAEVVLEAVYNNRREGYGSISDQLDEIYHDMDAWRARIAAVKAANPKPTEE